MKLTRHCAGDTRPGDFGGAAPGIELRLGDLEGETESGPATAVGAGVVSAVVLEACASAFGVGGAEVREEEVGRAMGRDSENGGSDDGG